MERFRISPGFYFFILFFLVFSPLSFAERTGLYGGLKVGYSYHADACGDTAMNCQNDGFIYGLVAGYSIVEAMGLEMTVYKLPDTEATYPPNFKMVGELLTTDLSARYNFPNGGRTGNFYAKLGVAYWRSDIDMPVGTMNDDGFSPTVYVGYERPLSRNTSWQIGYQFMDDVGEASIGHTDIHLINFSLLWGRGERVKYTASPAAAPQPESAPKPQPVTRPEAVEERVTISDQVQGPLFASGSDVIQSYVAIDHVVATVRQRPQANILIMGHTDSQGSDSYNQNLSERRAQAVATYLIKQGVDQDRLSWLGMGETAPVADNATVEGRAQNRRVEFVITQD